LYFIKVKNCVEEIEKEKQMALNKKIEEKEALQLLLQENELRKITLSEQKKEQKNIDIKSMIDMQKVVEQREKDRNDYFKIRERRSGETAFKAIETVVKAMNMKNIEEEEAIKRFEVERDRR